MVFLNQELTTGSRQAICVTSFISIVYEKVCPIALKRRCVTVRGRVPARFSLSGVMRDGVLSRISP